MSSHPIGDGPGFSRNLLDIAVNARQMVDLVRFGAYRQIFGSGRRLDWAVSVAGYANDQATNNPVPWTALTIGRWGITGRALSATLGQAYGAQFGQDDLRNQRQSMKTPVLLTAVFRDWLERSGYTQPQPTVEEIVHQAIEFLSWKPPAE